MDHRQVSRTINHLLAYRCLRTKVHKGERPNGEEILLAEGLLGASENERIFIDEYLSETGFKLVTYTYSRMPGLPKGSTYFLLIRDPEETRAEWLDLKSVYKEIALTDAESKTTSRIWFFFIWINTLTLLYTRTSRAITSISSYASANFTKEQLIQQIKTVLEESRNIQQEDDVEKKVNSVLLEEKNNEVNRRVRFFIKHLIRISYLEEQKDSEETSYCQTLIMATELKENYEQGLGFRFHGDKNARESLVDNLKNPYQENASSIEEEV